MDDATDRGSDQRLHLASAITKLDTCIGAETNRARHILLTSIRQDIMAASNAHMGSQQVAS